MVVEVVVVVMIMMMIKIRWKRMKRAMIWWLVF